MIIVTHPEALYWKHNYPPGLSTLEGILTAWPPSLGPEPSQGQVRIWEAEWLAFKNDPKNSETTINDVLVTVKNLLDSLGVTAVQFETALENAKSNR